VLSRYVIGDVQGCIEPLQRLLDTLPLGPDDQIWFTGDLVNRGPHSLEVLRFVKGLGTRARTILGNHDLHLLCVAEGFARLHTGDTLDPILAAPDRDELLTWLRMRALAMYEDGFLMVHAGVFPSWSSEQTIFLAHEVETFLHGPRYQDFLSVMYGNEPNHWDNALVGFERLRSIVNALTRMRLCTPEGRLDFSHKGALADAPNGLIPWFDVPNRLTSDHTVIFGHWSALGLVMKSNLIGVDTGCLWGRTLTAVRLEDRRVFSVPCHPN
jgi:bis(5'-nucleosyl)-tetraphosphatase (symmetrical)